MRVIKAQFQNKHKKGSLENMMSSLFDLVVALHQWQHDNQTECKKSFGDHSPTRVLIRNGKQNHSIG